MLDRAKVMWRWFLLAALCFSLQAFAVEEEVVTVTAAGLAAPELANHREIALADALREAVRIGAGVSIASATKTESGQLEYDRIFASSFGYVRDYQVLQTGIRKDGIFEVRLRAQVGKGAPEVQERLALRQLIHRKQAPRVGLLVDERIGGLAAPTAFSFQWVQAFARDLELNVDDVLDQGGRAGRLQARDALRGETNRLAERQLNLEYPGDLILRVKLDGTYLGKRSLYGSHPQHRFSLRCDLSVLYPDSQKAAVSLSLPGTEDFETTKEDPMTAAREAVFQLLDGRFPKPRKNGTDLFRKLVAVWITELDLGTILKVEIDRVGQDAYDALVDKLNSTPGVSGVYPGTFDRGGLSYLEVGSRLDSRTLARTIKTGLGDRFVLDRSTRHFIQFVPNQDGKERAR